jgi:20S proteasome subunit alpha 3
MNPSRDFGGWKVTAIGENNQTAQSILKSEYKDGMSAIEAMNLTLDSSNLRFDKLEFFSASIL